MRFGLIRFVGVGLTVGPLDVIKLGQIEMLADWVDDARLGNPD